MMLLLLSIVCWAFILWSGTTGPRILVPSSIRGGGGGGTPETTTTYHYQISAPHQSINPNYPIYCYDAYGTLVYTISANDPNMNYGTGTYTVPGSAQNALIESISTASYKVSYSTDDITIDYENAEFYFNERLVSKPTSVTMWATFQYYTQFTAANDTGKIIDGNWDTQMQTVFYAEPPAGYQYAILDLGVVREIQTIDLIGGYFRPTEDVKFDCKYKATLKYSLDNITYYDIGKDTNSFSIEAANAVTFDEEKLGSGFRARYIQIVLEEVEKINYSKSSILVTDSNYGQLVASNIIDEGENNHAEVGDTIILREGLYAVALTEASAYSDIVLKAESFLIPMTQVVDVVSGGRIDVLSTDGFPESGTAYIALDSTKSFTYTSKTATSFLGVDLASGANIFTDDYITKSIETDTTLYDYSNLLPKLGDRVYKKNQSGTEYLYTQADLNYLSKEYLKEFVKNHGKIQAEVLFAPYLKMSHTVTVTDLYNGINNVRYFIENISYKQGSSSITLARFPG